MGFWQRHHTINRNQKTLKRQSKLKSTKMICISLQSPSNLSTKRTKHLRKLWRAVLFWKTGRIHCLLSHRLILTKTCWNLNPTIFCSERSPSTYKLLKQLHHHSSRNIWNRPNRHLRKKQQPNHQPPKLRRLAAKSSRIHGEKVRIMLQGIKLIKEAVIIINGYIFHNFDNGVAKRGVIA